jgi:hypothetical protein
MENFQVPDAEIAIEPKILKKLDLRKTDDNLKKYFLYYRTEPIGKYKGDEMAECRICDNICKRKNGSTNGMTYHLKVHRNLWEIYDHAKKEIALKNQRKKAPDGTGYQLF